MQQLLGGGGSSTTPGRNGVLSAQDARARERLLAKLNQQVAGMVGELGLPCGSVFFIGELSYACPGECDFSVT